MRFNQRIQQLLGLSIPSQLRWMVDSRTRGKVLLGRGVVVRMGRKASLWVQKGSLSLNAKWASGDPFKTFLCIMDGASLTVADNFAIYSGSRIYVRPGAKLSLGSGYANHGLEIDCHSSISIGKNVAIASNVVLRDSDNKSRVEGIEVVHSPIIIGNNVWIGMNAIILKGVRIGSGAIVAAGSVVNRNVAERTLVGGVPAKVLETDVHWH